MPNGQLKMDNREKLTTQSTQDKEQQQQQKHTTQYVLYTYYLMSSDLQLNRPFSTFLASC
jgi:hypothetical protein